MSEKRPNFSTVIKELIARDLSINPNEITPEFILRWREEHLYAHAQHGPNTKYGGYNTSFDRILSPSDIRAMQESAERFVRSWQTGLENDESNPDRSTAADS